MQGQDPGVGFRMKRVRGVGPKLSGDNDEQLSLAQHGGGIPTSCLVSSSSSLTSKGWDEGVKGMIDFNSAQHQLTRRMYLCSKRCWRYCMRSGWKLGESLAEARAKSNVSRGEVQEKRTESRLD